MPLLSSLASWRVAALLLAIINLKCLPFAWHLRLFYTMYRNWSKPSRVQQYLAAHRQDKTTHPIFQSVSVFSRSPLLETDYNFHKSNSTYFADLDVSRGALVTKLLASNMKQGKQDLEKEGHKGPANVILGSVHTSFHREIKPYQLYEVRSRVLGWDKKWLVILTYFIRPASKGKDEVVLASALSKYVIKKGRFTVAPERCLTTAGWLPPRPADSQSGAGQNRESSAASESPLNDQVQSSQLSQTEPSIISTPDNDGIAAPVPESAVDATASFIEKLESAAHLASASNTIDPLIPLTKLEDAGEWDWHRIEMERTRGIQIAAAWLSLDKELLDEAKHEE
ncbi:hypothetical protein PV10_06702 [Exophiala mesophila]|uniref:Thioesterase domain-containing protein n=1 Tax=Exophiala mesophila TaxID=212818 RepID=A0A0D1WST4_EXOME|nr:uncharacterized protein PV10_06702 [Exophiala mesophila]KIV92245.1 hypothetical protein PV10_06702 [Exophiala mesophila]